MSPTHPEPAAVRPVDDTDHPEHSDRRQDQTIDEAGFALLELAIAALVLGVLLLLATQGLSEAEGSSQSPIAR